jgi:hypothetical protein
LQEAVERRYDARGDEIDPDSRASFVVWVGGEEAFGGGVSIFEEFADDGTFVEWLIIVLEGGNKTARVEL